MQGLMIFQTWEFTPCCNPSADCVLLTGVHLGSVLGLSTSIEACAPTAEQVEYSTCYTQTHSIPTAHTAFYKHNGGAAMP